MSEANNLGVGVWVTDMWDRSAFKFYPDMTIENAAKRFAFEHFERQRLVDEDVDLTCHLSGYPMADFILRVGYQTKEFGNQVMTVKNLRGKVDEQIPGYECQQS